MMAGYLSPVYRWEVALSQIGKSGKDRNMDYIKFALVFFSFLWLCGAFAVGLDKAQRFHREGMERVRRIEGKEGKL